jgi:iron complex outermembrane receptor protein
VQDEWRAEAWRINAGLRADHYSSFGTTLNPRLALVHLVSPATTLKYLAGTAYRAPNVYEMHYHDGNITAKANPDLEPERVRSLEVAIEHVTGAGWRWGGSLFHNRIRDLIGQVTDPADGLLVYRNRGDARIRGAVVSLARQWAGGTRLALSSSWHDARDAASGERLTHTPRHVAKLDVTVPLGIWRATLEARHLGRRATGTGHVGSLAWGNVALVSARPVLGGGRFALRVDNVGDRDLADPASEEFDHDRLPREGRTARVTLAWAF